MKQSISLTPAEQKVLGWISIQETRSYFGPQKVIAEQVGYSRQHLNVILQGLAKKGQIYIYRSRTLNPKLRLITIEPLRGRNG